MISGYPDKYLQRVQRPGRYTGGEWNSITKDWAVIPFHVVLAFPDTYELGMANLGVPIVYDMLNKNPDMLAERVFAPWLDMEAVMRHNGLKLLSLENRRPLDEFDVVAFSLGYELGCTNVLNMLSLGGIPLHSAERTEQHPIVLAGGSFGLNPEPMADFIDAFFIGDGELCQHLFDTIAAWVKAGKMKKPELLKQLARLPGVYVPSLYRAEYNTDGTLASIEPFDDSIPRHVQRQIVSVLPPSVTRPIVPFLEATQDRAAVEIARGCSRGCRFCHAGIAYRPVRRRSPDEIIQAADDLIANCGYDEISLLSLSTADYPGIEGLVERMGQRYRNDHIAISVPSLRVSADTVKLIDSLPQKRRSGLTLAPEAASARLQLVINKIVPHEEILGAASAAFSAGWTGIKLYFMLGLPTETFDDLDEMVALINRLYALGRGASGRRPQLRLSLSSFVPKAHTPFQWVAQDSIETLTAKHQRLLAGLKSHGIRLSWSDPQASLLEAVLSRGDRRISQVIYRAYQGGARFDTWNDQFKFGLWEQAFEELGLDPDFYARRLRPLDEILPWSVIDSGVSSGYLKQEYRRALFGQATPDCSVDKCQACGLQKEVPECETRFKTGV